MSSAPPTEPANAPVDAGTVSELTMLREQLKQSEDQHEEMVLRVKQSEAMTMAAHKPQIESIREFFSRGLETDKDGKYTTKLAADLDRMINDSFTRSDLQPVSVAFLRVADNVKQLEAKAAESERMALTFETESKKAAETIKSLSDVNAKLQQSLKDNSYGPPMTSHFGVDPDRAEKRSLDAMQGESALVDVNAAADHPNKKARTGQTGFHYRDRSYHDSNLNSMLHELQNTRSQPVTHVHPPAHHH